MPYAVANSPGTPTERRRPRSVRRAITAERIGRPAADAVQIPMHRKPECRMRTYHHDDPGPKRFPALDMATSRRGNYNSGEDFVLEYGELRFTFNEEDFSERCEQAALKLGFVGGRLGEEGAEDLVNLAVNGEISDPASALGEHVNDCWPKLVETRRALACPLAAPPGVPRCVAGPARERA